MPPSLIGHYSAPSLRPGARVWCKYRRAWSRVTTYTDAPLSWPRVNAIGKTRGMPMPAATITARQKRGRLDGWTKYELQLLGTVKDAAVAERTGRTVHAVRMDRRRLSVRRFSAL